MQRQNKQKEFIELGEASGQDGAKGTSFTLSHEIATIITTTKNKQNKWHHGLQAHLH